MINFIICDDNEFFLSEIFNIVNDFCNKLKINYEIYVFKSYDKNFFDIVDSELDNKIYILDIETPSGNGVDVARKIRSKDLNSFLIFISAYTREYVSKVITSDTMFIGYISKRKNYKDELVKKLKKIFKLGFHDSNKRRSIIYTINNVIEVRLTLKRLKQILDYRFEYSHRSCIINHEQVLYIDTVVKIIKFKNGDTVNLLSDSFIKKIKDQQFYVHFTQ